MHKIIVSLFFSGLLGLTIQSSNHSVEFNQYPQSDLMLDGYLSLELLGFNIEEYQVHYEIDPVSQVEHYIIRQELNSIPVFGRDIRVHMNKNNVHASTSIDFFNGDYDLGLSFLSETEAVNIAISDFNSSDLVIKSIDRQYYVKNNYAHLCSFIDVVSNDKAFTYVVSLITGEILNRFSLIHTDGPIVGSGENLLGEWVDGLQVYEGTSFSDIGDLVTPYLLCEEYCWDYGDCDGGNYNNCTLSPNQGNCQDGYLEDCNGACFNDWYMEFPGVGNGFCNDPWINVMQEEISSNAYNLIDESAPDRGVIFTINSYGGFYSDLSYVNHNSEIFESEAPDDSHASGVSAHDYQRKTLDYMWERHGYAGIDGNGKRTISVVNYGPGGGISQNNAFFNAGLDVLSYGIAGGSYRPFCAAQDIVTHEFTHGFTAHTSGLIYQNQPGALNESISDVFGYLVEAEYQNGGDWTEGEDIRINGGASRSFSNPPVFGDPDNINHPYFVPYASDPNMFTNDFGGVHSNSGIPNKVLYLVVQGDEHYGINVAPLEVNIAESRYIASDIWFNWNAYYLGPEDDFSIGREKMLQVVQDLWPENYSYYQTVANAWASVGVGNPLIVGDINGDMIANIQDIIIMIGVVTESITPTETQSLIGDLNSDGIIDILDIVLVINIIFNS